MYEFDSRVRYSETDAQGRMTWLALMDYFQDCSVFHSEAVNLGVEGYFKKIVLSEDIGTARTLVWKYGPMHKRRGSYLPGRSV